VVRGARAGGSEDGHRGADEQPAAGPAARPSPPYADVAVPVPLRRAFTYRVPDDLRAGIHEGSLVKVPFGRRTAAGFVVGFRAKTELKLVKDIASVEDPELSLPADVLSLCRWVADYYLAPLGEVLRAALPAGLGKKSPGEVPHAAGSLPTIRLAEEQQVALNAINEAQRGGGYAAFLLHGVTGSGKTEVYLRAAADAVADGGKVLILVPEIALSPQMVRRVEARFGNRVALWHSALTPARRRAVWARTRRGEIDVLVGARSAIFAPIPDLRLIVVDEEHEGAYKQAETPRYHARDVALVRAREAGAVVVLGSATPSLETYANVERGKLRLLSLPHRVERRPRAKVDLVPLPALRPGPGERPLSPIFGDPLHRAITETLERGEQAILFLNRRGHSTVVQCEACREILSCDQCDIVLTWHADTDRLVCHYCGSKRPPPGTCPACGGPVTIYKGVGTQRVERELRRLYGGLRLQRLDTDSTRKRGALEAALEAFRHGEADVLLGTQMVAKGLDFPNVTLVGVVNADLQLALPDFRSAERTFQLLTQVAGRSGRGERPGRVLFQTAKPDHYALRAAAEQDYEAFYRAETAERRDPPYPPFRKLVNILFDGKSLDRVTAEADAVAGVLAKRIARDKLRVELLGPAPQPFSRLKGKHRWHLTLRGSDHHALRGLADLALDRHENTPGPVRVTVDVDPVSLL
jgi:primosomal protein N' (replication factor Y)